QYVGETMILRLRFYRFWLRTCNYALPLISFIITGYIWFSAPIPWLNREHREYAVLLMWTTAVWAVVAENHRLSNIEELFRENTGLRATLSACSTTFIVNVAVLFFFRSVSFSRVFVLISASVLLL